MLQKVKGSYSSEPTADKLDIAPSAVVVRGWENGEILYMNERARDMIKGSFKGQSTAFYKAFGFGQACSCCCNGQSGCHNGEIRVPQNRRVYRIDGKITDWSGRLACIEYIQDITEQRLLEKELKDKEAKVREMTDTLRETQMELNLLVNSISGGIASYRVTKNRLRPVYLSDGVIEISGYTRDEYEEMVRDDGLAMIYEPDRERIQEQVNDALISGEPLDVSYRMRHKNGNLVWIRLKGRRIGPIDETMRFYAIYSGISEEAYLYQNIASETADGIYVIAKGTYELLFANEPRGLFIRGKNYAGQKCFEALHGREEPCGFCKLNQFGADGREHEMRVDGHEQFYTARIRETDWNGIPAYIQYVRDITKEVNTRREKERLEMCYQTVLENLPGGISVIRCEPDGRLAPEYISDGFAGMLQMSVDKVRSLYADDISAGIHPADAEKYLNELHEYIECGEGNCEIIARIKREDGRYIWIKSTLSILHSPDGVCRLYSIVTDISKSMEEKEQLRRQYEDILIQHYRMPGPDELILGHCNITQNKILEILDHTDSDLLNTFGDVREEFFTGISGLVVDEEERKKFLSMYLNEPALTAFGRNEKEHILNCYIKLPREKQGRYVRFKVNLVETPDTGDITGVLTVTDVTEQTISDRILHQLSVTSYEYVIDLKLEEDSYTVVTCSKDAKYPPPPDGRYSERVAYMLKHAVAPGDRERYAAAMKPDVIRDRLEKEVSYTISYCVHMENGYILTKNMTVSAVDMRLGRVCLVCTDITASVQEVRRLLNMMAYTFERMGILHLGSRRFTMYTRRAVLNNLSPHIVEHYENEVEDFADGCGTGEEWEEIRRQFSVTTMLDRLETQPDGYDFVFPYQSEEELRYKQMNVLWGDDNHSTICMVRADVTDLITAERTAKQELEKALNLAEEANRAKSDFLSTMSHDIRTPMNAIIGMTTLASSHLEDRTRVEDYLNKISISSKHLLSLINDILDMSKIERSKISLNHMLISLPELISQLSAIISPQAREAGLELNVRTQGIQHDHFYGDSLRISQILINLLSNSVKFTPEGGSVDFCVEEVGNKGMSGKITYRFTVRDTGIGMSQDFIEGVFAPFARSRSVSRIEGTGLGLSITKGLVDLMGGRIHVESRVNEGSTFRVELECEASPLGAVTGSEGLEPGEPEPQEEGALNGRTFLVAEDNAINAEILCELLAMYGAKTVLRTDGIQAVNEFRNAEPGSYDAILMDIQMPEMNGYEATRAIRALKRSDAATVKIIAMTANAFYEDIQAAREAGMNAHVAKPIDMNILRSTLSGVLKE